LTPAMTWTRLIMESISNFFRSADTDPGKVKDRCRT
jgi:hypothetical protein